MADAKWIVLGVLGAIGLLVLGGAASAVAAYNGFVKEQTGIDAQSAQVDVQYQRAFRLVPQLLNLTQQYMRNEREVQENVTALRSGLVQAGNGSFAAKDAYATQLSNFIALVGNRVENYPDLKANVLFRDTMDEVINTENKVAMEKLRYNQRVETYNAHLRECCIPALVAGSMRFGPREFIRFSDRPLESPFPAGQNL